MNDIDIKIQELRGDFYEMLREALRSCEGCDNQKTIERLQETKLKDVVDTLAQNGIRMIFIKNKSL